MTSEMKWFEKYYAENKICKAENLEEIKKRLSEDEVYFFTPWGPRYDWSTRGALIKKDDREMETLAKLQQINNDFTEQFGGGKIKWLFLGADLYGTRINSVPQTVVDTYFKSLAEILGQLLPEATFKLWSEFDQQAQLYRQEVRNNLETLVGDSSVLARAEKTSALMGGNKVSAKTYVVERMAEAMLIENLYRPIKISLADKGKDGKVDWDLPRLYLVAPELQAPWMKAKAQESK